MGEHVLYLDSDFETGRWCAGCSCGWEGKRMWSDHEEAVEDFDNHCDVVFMEATGG